VAPRLQTFRQGGLVKLAALVSEMGISLEAAKQPYGEQGGWGWG
jgi:hypothetical protein